MLCILICQISNGLNFTQNQIFAYFFHSLDQSFFFIFSCFDSQVLINYNITLVFNLPKSKKIAFQLTRIIEDYFFFFASVARITDVIPTSQQQQQPPTQSIALKGKIKEKVKDK